MTPGELGILCPPSDDIDPPVLQDVLVLLVEDDEEVVEEAVGNEMTAETDSTCFLLFLPRFFFSATDSFTSIVCVVLMVISLKGKDEEEDVVVKYRAKTGSDRRGDKLPTSADCIVVVKPRPNLTPDINVVFFHINDNISLQLVFNDNKIFHYNHSSKSHSNIY